MTIISNSPRMTPLIMSENRERITESFSNPVMEEQKPSIENQETTPAPTGWTKIPFGD